MADGSGDPHVIQRTPRESLANMNLTELDEARGVASYKRSARLKQSSALVGDVAGRDFIRAEYRGRARQIVMRRGNNVPVFDHLYEVGPGEFVVAEGKANQAPFGKTSRKTRVFKAGEQGTRVIEGTVRKAVVQFSPEWFEQRLAELRRDFGPEGRRLANRLETSWRSGKLRAVAIRAPEASRTAEHVLVEDVSKQWNDHIGATSQHTMPIDRRPKVITDPARLLQAPPTQVERGLEAAEKTVAHVEPHLPAPRLSTAEHLGEGALKVAEHGFKARSLVIGVKAWRAARTIGKVLIVCFVPLTVFDVVIEVAMAMWDREREKEERQRRDKQHALETVFKADRKTGILQQGIVRNIVSNAAVQAAFLSAWDTNKAYPGFQYARLHATLSVESYRDTMGRDSESLTKYNLLALSVLATDWSHDFELEDIGEERIEDKTDDDKLDLIKKDGLSSLNLMKVVKRQKLSYTIVPPLLTPYDIVVMKINNLFLDIACFCAQFSGLDEMIVENFEFNYTYRWDEQFVVALEFPQPLDPAVCEYCLAYLHYAAKQLSGHPLQQQDLEGNLEDPHRGWQRRFWLLNSIVEGERTRHGKNFSYFAAQVKSLVRSGRKDAEISAGIDQLFTGARAIWYDLERIERNLKESEYFYLGPGYKPKK